MYPANEYEFLIHFSLGALIGHDVVNIVFALSAFLKFVIRPGIFSTRPDD